MHFNFFIGTSIFESLGIEWQTMLFYLVNLILLFIIIRIFFYKPIREIIKARKEKIEETFAKNKKLVENSEKIKKEYEETLQKTKQEVAQFFEESKKQAKELAEKEISVAQEKASKIIEDAYVDAEHMKEQMKEQMKEAITQYSILIATKILEREVNVSDNKKCIDSILSNLK